jgi:group I intron endonuclease
MGGLVIKKSGVYIITCKSNDKHYIGYSVNITKRLNSHKSMLRTKKHPNQHLQAAYNLYGAENFSFEILEQYPDEFMASMENWWCNLLNTHDNRFGFNLKNTGERVHKHNESTKKKLSELKMGKPLPTKGRKLSPERVEQNRLCHIGIKHTKESKEKMSIVQSEFRYAILKPDGTYVQVTSLQKFAKENKVSYSALLYTIKGYNEKGQTVTQIKGYSVLVKKKIGEEITKEEIENRISELKRVKEAK